MDPFNMRLQSTSNHLDFPSFNHSGTNIQDDSSLGLMELSLSLRNQLNSLKSIKKDFTKRFDNVLLSSGKKDMINEAINYEQKYNDLKARYDELEEIHQSQIDETLQTLKEARQGHDRKIRGLEEDLLQKDNYIDVVKQGHLQAQEKINLLETRITSLEQLNSTLTLQLKEKSRELNGTIDNMGNSMTSRSRDIATMKSDFTRVVDRIANLEDIIKNLKEGKRQDNKVIEDIQAKNEELKTENFQLLMENKKLKNEIEEYSTKFLSLDKCFLERRQKTDDFINTLVGYKSSFQVINQVHLDLEKVFEPLKEQNRRLLEDKEKLLEENRELKLRISSLEQPKNTEMEEEIDGAGKEGEEGKANGEKQVNGVRAGIDHKFYVEVMEKFKEFEKQIEAKKKENNDLQTELDEIKTQKLELETRIISLNRSPSRRKNDQFLGVEVESTNFPILSPRRNRSVIQNSPDASVHQAEEETKEEQPRDNPEAMEDENERDSRLKINRKPKAAPAAKKNPLANILGAVSICPICSLIIKKSDKNTNCTKCRCSIHEKCTDDQKGKDVMCVTCQKKYRKTVQENNDEEEESGEKDKQNVTVETIVVEEIVEIKETTS